MMQVHVVFDASREAYRHPELAPLGLDPWTYKIIDTHEDPLWVDVEKYEYGRDPSFFATQEEAVAQARHVARMLRAELFIHSKNGQFREKDSEGNDPYPPLG